MPTPTYIALATVTLTTTDSEVVFSSIPSTYRDLVVITDQPALGGLNELVARLNSDSGSNYSRVFMEGRSGGASSVAQSGLDRAYVGAYGNSKAMLTMQIFDYAQTNKHKTILARGDSPEGTKATAVRWASTAAVNTVSVLMNTGSLPSGTTISLYGVAA